MPSLDSEKMIKQLDSIFKKSVPSATRGLSALISINGKVVYNRALGAIKELNFRYEQDTIYDLASLTKPLVTSLLFCKLLSRGEIALGDTLSELGLFTQYRNLKNLSIEALLTHTSGLIPDKPLYKEGNNRASYLSEIDKEAEKAVPFTRELYSDLNYILLGFMLEELYGKSLGAIWKDEIGDKLGLKSSGFNLSVEREKVAPTEVTEDRGLVWGKVHDEKSYFIGGEAGHAGLFSSSYDVWKLLQSFLNGEIVSEKVVKLAISNRNAQFGGMFGLGWMTKVPAPAKRSESFYLNEFMGDFAPYGTFGHTGFTGTSVCANLDLNLICILLTNRVYPTRESNGILSLRRRFHNAVFLNVS
ncbi:MAG: serine hydrolase domain-containing protein [Nitrososphaerota archaeon]